MEAVGLVNSGWSGDDRKAGLGSIDLDLRFNILCAQPSTRSYVLGSRSNRSIGRAKPILIL